MLIKFKVHLVLFGAKTKVVIKGIGDFTLSHTEKDTGSENYYYYSFLVLPRITLRHGIYRTWVDLSNLDSAQHENESAVASELQKLVTENLGTCTCLLNGDKKMPKAFGLHF